MLPSASYWATGGIAAILSIAVEWVTKENVYLIIVSPLLPSKQISHPHLSPSPSSPTSSPSSPAPPPSHLLKRAGAQTLEGHTEPFGPHPFTWKTPNPSEDIRIQKFGFNKRLRSFILPNSQLSFRHLRFGGESRPMIERLCCARAHSKA